MKHGSHNSTVRHVGDFGNIFAEANGEAKFDLDIDEATIFDGLKSIVGRAIVVHELEDDLGLNADSESSELTGLPFINGMLPLISVTTFGAILPLW